MFTHLHLHTHYSLLEAIGAPKAYIEQATSLGMETLAYTDYGGMYGAIEFYQAAKKAGIKAILGVELGYVPDMHRQDPQESAGTIVLLARSYAGYEQLMQLISAAHLQWYHKLPRIDHACLAQHATDLIALVGGERSWLGKLLIQGGDPQHAIDQRTQLTNTLGNEHCYLSWIAQEVPQWPTHLCNSRILDFSQQLNVPMFLSGDVHYIHAKDQHIFETALAIKDGKRIYDTDRRLAPRAMHLQTEQELRDRCQKAELSDDTIDRLVDTTTHIASTINLQIPMDKILFPIYESPEEIKTQFQKYEHNLISV